MAHSFAILSLENPLFPTLITSALGRLLLEDLAALGELTLSYGDGVYKGVSEKCICVGFDSEGDAENFAPTVLLLARWAGQESVLFVDAVSANDDGQYAAVLATVQGPDEGKTEEFIWREAAGEPDLGDHTILNGTIYVLEKA